MTETSTIVIIAAFAASNAIVAIVAYRIGKLKQQCTRTINDATNDGANGMIEKRNIVLNYLVEELKTHLENMKWLDEEIDIFESAVNAKGREHASFDEWKDHARKMRRAKEEKKIVECLKEVIESI